MYDPALAEINTKKFAQPHFKVDQTLMDQFMTDATPLVKGFHNMLTSPTWHVQPSEGGSGYT
eukprot:12403894-Karenia_brevis.AAC.1